MFYKQIGNSKFT